MADAVDTWRANGPFRRILVGWDAKEGSTHAFSIAVRLAQCCDAELLVLSVARIPDHVESKEDRTASLEAAQRFYTGRLGTIDHVAKHAGVIYHHDVVPSSQRPETIIAYAHAHTCDLIVLGSHKNHGGLARLLTGMVGEAVARAAPCPVLLVPFGDDC